MIGGGEVQLLLIKLRPLRCFMSTRMEHSGDCNHKRPIEAVKDMIGDTCLILDVDNSKDLSVLIKPSTLNWVLY